MPWLAIFTKPVMLSFSKTGCQKFHGSIHDEEDLVWCQVVNYITCDSILMNRSKDVFLPFIQLGNPLRDKSCPTKFTMICESSQSPHKGPRQDPTHATFYCDGFIGLPPYCSPFLKGPKIICTDKQVNSKDLAISTDIWKPRTLWVGVLAFFGFDVFISNLCLPPPQALRFQSQSRSRRARSTGNWERSREGERREAKCLQWFGRFLGNFVVYNVIVK